MAVVASMQEFIRSRVEIASKSYVARHAGTTPDEVKRSERRRAQLDFERALKLLDVQVTRGDLKALRLHLTLSHPTHLRALAVAG